MDILQLVMCKLINPENGECEQIFNDFVGSVRCLVELENERIVVCSGIHISKIQIWNTKTNQCEKILENENIYIQKMVVFPDKRIMGVGTDKHCVKRFTIWDPHVSCVGISFSNIISKCQFVSACVDVRANGDALISTNHHLLARWNPQTNKFLIVSKEKFDDCDSCSLLLSNGNVLMFQQKQLFIFVEKKGKYHQELIHSTKLKLNSLLELPFQMNVLHVLLPTI